MIGKQIGITIDEIGSNGDGVGRFDDAPVYVPLTLPGDALTVRLTTRRGQGHAADVLEEHRLASRQEPVCRHFGSCGGCRLQHVQPFDYRQWKRRRIETALASRGIDKVEIKPLIDGHSAIRRRLRLALHQDSRGLVLGFRKRQGREIVSIEECPIALPAIVSLFKPLQENLNALDMAGKGGELSITAADNGLDVLIEMPIPPGLSDREALAALAETEDLARLAWRADARTPPEPIAVRRPPQVHIGGVPLGLPIGAFLQATSEAEQAIRDAIAQALGASAVIADLFAGCGTLSLPLAKKGRRLHAMERDTAMIEAISSACSAAGLAGRVDATVRNLDREPVSGDELEPFDGLIIDPPRAGARAQVEALAAAPHPARVAMVSCNPTTFARDARILIDAGYRLAWVQPIDAFLYAAEIELVGAFEHAVAP